MQSDKFLDKIYYIIVEERVKRIFRHCVYRFFAVCRHIAVLAVLSHIPDRNHTAAFKVCHQYRHLRFVKTVSGKIPVSKLYHFCKLEFVVVVQQSRFKIIRINKQIFNGLVHNKSLQAAFIKVCIRLLVILVKCHGQILPVLLLYFKTCKRFGIERCYIKICHIGNILHYSLARHFAHSIDHIRIGFFDIKIIPVGCLISYIKC